MAGSDRRSADWRARVGNFDLLTSLRDERRRRRQVAELRLDWALLANAAEGPPNGLVYILGAGIDTLWREQFPAPFGGAMVLRVLSSRLESERLHKVEVHCSDVAANIVINLSGVALPKPGFYRFEILIDDQQVRTLPFRAVQPPKSDS